MEKELELASSSSGDGEMGEYISEPENRRKGGFITMPFIIGLFILLGICLLLLCNLLCSVINNNEMLWLMLQQMRH